MKKLWSMHKGWAVGLAALSVLVLAVYAFAGDALGVHSFTFDPFHTKLVAAEWMIGAGCPTDATTNDGTGPVTFSDAACPTGAGDPTDHDNKGLVLIKTGPSVANFASADAFITGVKGITLSELGYDIRIGSHCGAGAPRFNVVTTDGVNHFLGCNSPAPDSITPGTGWERRRWVAAGLAAAFPPISPSDKVSSIAIIFDEGTDTPNPFPNPPPGLLGGAVLDNIDVNGTLKGKE